MRGSSSTFRIGRHHQLRHNAGTRLKAKFGAEVARAVLGHAHVSTTEIYIEQDVGEAVRAMEKIG